VTIPRHESRPHRIVAVAAIVALLGAGALLDRAHRPSPTGSARRLASVGMPVEAPPGALSSSWFCAFAGAPAGASASGVLGIVNPGAEAVSGTVTFIPSQGATRTRAIDVGAHAATTVAEAAGPAPFVAALVDMDGGGVAVEQAITGSAGIAGAPCATSASSQWHFADGTTAKDDTLLIGLFNPFPDDAVVDFAFTTDQGREANIGALQAVPVPARSLVVVDIGQHLRRRAHVATSITARVGRIVAAQLQGKRPAAGPAGLSLEIGGGRPETSWTFADGLARPGLTESFHLYNPGPDDARVEVHLLLDQGSADPFTVDVPPFATATIDANHDPRMPSGVGHAVVFRSVNGTGVVVDRSYDVAPAANHTAVVESTPASEAAPAWAFALGQASSGADEWLIVFNPGPSPVQVNVIIPDGGHQLPVPGLEGLTVAGGHRVVLRLGDHLQRAVLPLVVQATGPIVAERNLAVVGGPGAIATVGVPLAGQ
jgi:hypothetical protein